MNIRDLEGASILLFLEANKTHLAGSVLDFGSGLQPYRSVVLSAGGSYQPFDSPGYPGSVAQEHILPDQDELFDTVICTQVIQYAEDPIEMLREVWDYTKPGGLLLMTGPTNWPLVEQTDLWRFTVQGIKRLVSYVGFDIEMCEYRAVSRMGGEQWPLGWKLRAVK